MKQAVKTYNEEHMVEVDRYGKLQPSGWAKYNADRPFTGNQTKPNSILRVRLPVSGEDDLTLAKEHMLMMLIQAIVNYRLVKFDVREGVYTASLSVGLPWKGKNYGYASLKELAKKYGEPQRIKKGEHHLSLRGISETGRFSSKPRKVPAIRGSSWSG